MEPDVTVGIVESLTDLSVRSLSRRIAALLEAAIDKYQNDSESATLVVERFRFAEKFFALPSLSQRPVA